MQSSKRAIKILTPLFLSAELMFIGEAIVLASVGIILKASNIGEFTIGLVSSFYFLGAIFCTFFISNIISKIGHTRAYTIFSAIFAISALLHALNQNLIYWAFLRFMLGLSYYSLVIIIEIWINSKISNQIRSRVLACYEVVFYSAFAIGTLILGLNLSPTAIFIFSGIFIILGLIPLNIFKNKQPPLPQTKKIKIPNIFKIAPLALATSLSGGILINGFLSMASVFILSLGFGVKEVSLFIALATIGGLVSHIFFGFFSDKFGRKFAIMGVCVLGILTSILSLFFSQNLSVMWILAFFLGGGVFPLYSLALARANDVIKDKKLIADASAALMLGYSTASSISPVILGSAMQIFGAKGFNIIYIITLSALFIFATFQKNIKN